jgi:hypothetical protein
MIAVRDHRKAIVQEHPLGAHPSDPLVRTTSTPVNRSILPNHGNIFRTMDYMEMASISASCKEHPPTPVEDYQCWQDSLCSTPVLPICCSADHIDK